LYIPEKTVIPDKPQLPALELKELVVDMPDDKQEPVKEDLSRVTLIKPKATKTLRIIENKAEEQQFAILSSNYRSEQEERRKAQKKASLLEQENSALKSKNEDMQRRLNEKMDEVAATVKQLSSWQYRWRNPLSQDADHLCKLQSIQY